jgi:hypothetical protein
VEIEIAQQRPVGLVDVDQQPYEDGDGDAGREVDQEQPMPRKVSVRKPPIVGPKVDEKARVFNRFFSV